MKLVRQHLGWKLFISYLLIILVGIVSLIVTAEIHTPIAIERHMIGMGMMGEGAGPGMMTDLTLNFQRAVNETLLVAASLAVVTAVLVSSFVTQRIVRPIQAMKEASGRIADGRYAERIEVIGEDELAQLGRSFNRMAQTLAQTEERRRQLLGDVAHELRTPLSSIRSIIEGLQDGVLFPTPETLSGVEGEVNRLQRLVRDLEELSRAEAGQISLEVERLHPRDLVATAAERLAFQFEEKGVELTIDLPPDLPPFDGDPARMTQVLLNLLGNALQYTPAGGRVVVEGEQSGDLIELHVRDTGIGISPHHLPHIFERFYRVDKSRARPGGGSGIGLTIARHLVEAHGGRLTATSPGPGQGSTFTIYLPAARATSL